LEILSRSGKDGVNWTTQRAAAMAASEPRNPFYFLLLAVSLLFAVTALACAVALTLQQKSVDARPPSPLREAVQRDGWKWLLYEVAAMIVLGLFSMGLDRLRRLQKERTVDTIPPKDSERSSD
jgi:hypothetical protein